MLPVDRNNMNYVSVVIVGYFFYAILYWKFKGVKEFHSLEDDDDDDEADDSITQFASPESVAPQGGSNDSFDNISDSNKEIININEVYKGKQ